MSILLHLLHLSTESSSAHLLQPDLLSVEFLLLPLQLLPLSLQLLRLPVDVIPLVGQVAFVLPQLLVGVSGFMVQSLVSGRELKRTRRIK